MSDLKKYRGLLTIILVAALLLLVTVGDIEGTMHMNGLLIFPLLEIGSFGILYFIAREFSKKYSVLIILISALTLLYVLYVIAYDIPEDDWTFNLIALPIPVFILLWLFEKWKWIKELESEKEKAELSLLKSQVNPHFFFNTLNNLHALVVKKSSSAPDVILKLSEMMRYTIYEGEKPSVPLKQEVEYLTNYIDLHKIRYHRNVDIRFTSSIDQQGEIAPMLLITLLENAFKHGIESMVESAFIHMNLESTENMIEFTISNNFNAETHSANKGIGLENLKHRLELLYPKKHELTIDQANDLFNVRLQIHLK